ncbi:MAG: cyclic nucleotide-binding domain-containing protein [Actinobacteria bacterium]|nr:cyclic nucleotide-binding domain-containing protein [Actinomycetota bacterium]
MVPTEGELMAEERAVGLLTRSKLFRDLDTEVLQAIAARMASRSYRKGERVFHQGDPGDAMYVVVEGLVKVVVISEDGDEMVLVTLGPAQSFGELALIDGEPRSAGAEAVEPTTLLVITRQALSESLRQHPEIAEKLLRSLGSVIRRLTEQTADLVFLDLHGRVAKLLLGFAEEQGKPDEQGILLDLHLTQQEVAAMVGGSRQSVNQILRGFADRGYLELQGRTVVLKDMDRLRRRAGL